MFAPERKPRRDRLALPQRERMTCLFAKEVLTKTLDNRVSTV